MKAQEELGEVASALLAEVGLNSATVHPGNVPEESADVVICLMVLVSRWYPNSDLLVEVHKKLQLLNDPTSGHKSALFRED